MIDAEKMVEKGEPIGRYPGITLRNAHFQYIVTWYNLVEMTLTQVFVGGCDNWDVLFLVQTAEGYLCGAGIECKSVWWRCSQGNERMVLAKT